MMSTSEAFISYLKSEGFSPAGKAKGAMRFMRQDEECPYLADHVSVVPRESFGDFHIEFSRCYPLPSVIFLAGEQYGFYEKILTIWSDGNFLESTGGISCDEVGFSNCGDVSQVVQRFSDLVRELLPKASPIDVLNRNLFLDLSKNDTVLYGKREYPGGLPDPERRDYRGPNGNRQLIFCFFYLLGDVKNALFWANNIRENPEFADAAYISSVNQWVLTAMAELKSGHLRSFRLPKWARAREFAPVAMT